ncbi:MAG: cytochrome ubiquinol oxidase subunit I [Lactobacillaceae bacterium]|jgi:cytochrome d ubiquinol oxidase subunit I|nr:cytochrome ubiquinol oxidase subunit I [Lactobacillaceae bacterium]
MNLSLFSVLDLSRFQFAMTTIFHFFFVPLSIGLGTIVAIMETLYVVKKDNVYKKMAKFWGKIFLLSFAVGVPTGIIQEFQFGMNWSDYSRYVGDIFGAPLAVEALVAFFAESTFIGLWMFTWDRFKPVVHMIFIWVTAFASAISALWILAANSFMQNPVAYAVNHGMKRVELTDFFQLLKNPQLWYEFPHVILGAFVTAAFVVIGMSAFRLLKSEKIGVNLTTFYRKSLTIAAVVGLVSVLGSVVSGDQQTLFLSKQQPMKFAAMEGVDNTINSADRKDKALPWTLVGVWNSKTNKFIGKLEIPYALSVLENHSINGGKVKGMNQLNTELKEKYGNKSKDYYVPVNTLFYSFRIMAFGGGLLLILAAVSLYWNRKKSDQILKYKWFLWILGITTFIPFVINSAGWLVTELGRYPWTVYGLFTIADSVSPSATVTSLLFTNIVFLLSFGLLGILMIIFSRNVLHAGPDEANYETVAKAKSRNLKVTKEAL